MAAAQNGMMTFVGKGRTYMIDVYFSDGAGVPATFNPSGAAVAGSPQYWRPPEQVTLVDFSVHTGMTETASYLTEDSATKNGGVLRYANFLDTLANRPKLAITFPAGCLVGALQI